MKSVKLLLLFLIAGFSFQSRAQNDTLLFNKVGEFKYSFLYSCYTAIFDELGRDYIFTTRNEIGIITFDISDIQNPQPIDTILPSQLNGWKMTNVSQNGYYLYASIGGFQSGNQDAGLAIIDVTDPSSPVLTDVWDSTYFDEGAAIALNVGDYAYLGVMDSGLVILNVADKNNIQYVSYVHPFANFPQVPGPFSIPNGRGLTFRNDTILLCNDAGGFRMIDVTDKNNPVEVDMYVNTALHAQAAAAYNNVALSFDQKYAYIPVDYCGLDVVDVSGGATSNVNWINPWNCSPTNWDGNDGHTNQIENYGDSLLFMSGGNTELLVYDISDKTNPTLFAGYYNLMDTMACWGMDVKDNRVVLAMINNPIGVPYDSNWGGIQILEFTPSSTSNISEPEIPTVKIFPNPASGQINIITEEPIKEVFVTSPEGKTFEVSFAGNNLLEVDHLPSGMYFLQIKFQNYIVVEKIIIN